MEASDIKVLLCQIRYDKVMQEHELGCYTDGPVSAGQITSVDFTRKVVFDPEDVRHFDVVIIGGSGDYNVRTFKKLHKKNYFILKSILLRSKSMKKAVFAACFGLQFDCDVSGGKVILDKKNSEVGTTLITLTEQGRSDILFEGFPSGFKAQSVHYDRVEKMPPDAVRLAYSEKCPVQAYRYADNPNGYYFQFHPELDYKRAVERLEYYKSYADGNYGALLSSFEETPVASEIFESFLLKIVLG